MATTSVDKINAIAIARGSSDPSNRDVLWIDESISGTIYERTKYYNLESGAWELVQRTTAQLLLDLKTVDGAGSGLDADTLQGYTPEQLIQESTGIPSLSTGELLVGQASGTGAAQALSGIATINDSGVLSYVTNSISHTGLTDIGTNTHAQIDTHIASTANPHGVTAAQVGNTTAQWNANSIEGNLTNIGTLGAGEDGYTITWDNATSRFIVSAGGGNTIYTADDSLTGARNINQATFQLSFTNGDFFVGASSKAGSEGFSVQKAESFIGDVTAQQDSSAVLSLGSTTKGFLPPRMTTIQKNAISTPATGLLVFDDDLDEYQYYDGSAWVSFGASGVLGIADTSGSYTFYADYSAAITAASAGETVEQFGNITETGATEIILKNGVDINMNGYTYEMSNSSTTLDAFTDNNVAVTVNMYNGTIKRSGATGNSARGLHINNAGSIIGLSGVTVESTFGVCINNDGVINGGYTSNTAGSLAIVNEGTIRDLINNGFGRVDQSSGANARLVSVDSKTTGAEGIYITAGEAHHCRAESSAGNAIRCQGTELYNCYGKSTGGGGNGISCSSSVVLYRCEGYSTASYGLNIGSANTTATHCIGESTTADGIFIAGNNAKLYFCTGISSADAGIYCFDTTAADVVKCTGISTWNNAAGHGFLIGDADFRIVDCFAQVANTSAYGYQANALSPYLAGNKGRGMTTLINSGGNGQTSTPDTYNNFIID